MAKEYIEREALISEYDKAVKWLKENSHIMNQQDYIERMTAMQAGKTMTEAIPAADVVPVRHGRWINICGDRESPRQCSVCLQDFAYIDGICYLVSGQRLPQYCPNCGAKMDGDGNG